VLEELGRIRCPTLLLWADQDERHPLTTAEEALDLLPDGLLRVVDRTGFLMAYDDPVGVAREMAAFLV
ncbi:MAG TPA: alpha/beta hydrolase, partial [Capillimicrobium sp.]|nr:alpha/beta hydrolase [Capillimicrobium sp.]